MKSKKEQFISPKILLPHIDLASLPLLSLQFMLEIPAVFTITYTDSPCNLHLKKQSPADRLVDRRFMKA